MHISVEKIATFLGHKDCVYNILPDQNDSDFYSVAGDGMVVKWNSNNPENGELLAKMPHSIYAFAYLKAHNQLVIGQNFEGIHLIQLDNKTELKSIKLTDSYIFDILFFDNKLAVACGDGNVHIIDYESFTKIITLSFSQRSARCLAYHLHLKELAIGYSDNIIRIVKINNFSLSQCLFGHTISVFSLCYSPDYKYLLSGSRDAKLKIWECWNHYVASETIAAHLYAINHLAYSPDNQFFATCSMDKSIKIWDAQTFKLLKVIDKSRHAGHGTSVNKLAWMNHNLLLSCSDDKKNIALENQLIDYKTATSIDMVSQIASALQKKLIGKILIDCFSQNKDELIFGFGDTKEDFWIRANFDVNIGLLNFPECVNRAKKNSVDIFVSLKNKKVLAIHFHHNERSFHLVFENDFDLIFKLHGKNSNLILVQNFKTIDVFKHNLANDMRIEILNYLHENTLVDASNCLAVINQFYAAYTKEFYVESQKKSGSFGTKR